MKSPPRAAAPKSPDAKPDFNRRDFLKGSSFATMMAMLSAGPRVLAQEDEEISETQSGEPVRVALIGAGAWGREILNTLARIESATVAAICDTYPAMLRRAQRMVPDAALVEDYTKVLSDKSIDAVIVATPTHLHKEIVINALKAGKHVYCEAPLAHTIEDARAIAQAARDAKRQYFQPGLGLRSDPQRLFLLPFIRAGAAGHPVKARTQWSKKQSLRRTSPSPEREREQNWRLSRETSPGLLPELAIHQIDNIAWYFNRRPIAVTGFAGTILWNDGRDVPDTVQAVYEFPNGAVLNAEVTLCNSFDSEYEMIYGSDATVMLRGNKAWMFKEVDAPLLGWEVYARKDTFYQETGIALVANATKLKAQGDKPVEEAPYSNTPLYYALEAFIYNSDIVKTAVRDFIDLFGDSDPSALADALAQATVNNKAAATWRDGYEATVLALKGSEAAWKRQRIEIPEELFQI